MDTTLIQTIGQTYALHLSLLSFVLVALVGMIGAKRLWLSRGFPG